VVLRKFEASEEKRSILLAIKTEGDELEEERELAQRAEEEQANHGATAAAPCLPCRVIVEQQFLAAPPSLCGSALAALYQLQLMASCFSFALDLGNR
jgi:hypothetical protein